MHLGLKLLLRYEGKVVEGKVTKIFSEDLEIELDDKTIVRRKFWEIRRKDEK